MKLKEYRKTRKISQMQLAELCESSTGYIGEIESGKRFPSVSMIERIAKALEIESYQLFENKPNSSFPNSVIKLTPSQKKKFVSRVNAVMLKALDEI